MKKIRLLLALCLSLNFVSLFGQDTEFWFAGPVSLTAGPWDLYMGKGGFVFSNPTNRQATVNIKYYKDASDTTIVIPAFSYNYMYYPNEQDIFDKIEDFVGPLGIPRSTAIHITSNVAVTCYYIFDRKHQQETFLLKGKAALGTDFYIPTGRSGSVFSTSNNTYLGNAIQPYISIAATENGTTVSFDLKSAVTGFPAGPGSAMLNKGETLTLHSASGNLAGSHITSDKPITVTTGEECRSSTNGACDHNADQIVTNSFAGNVYVMTLTAGYMPTSPTWITNYFEMVALEPNTNVTIDWGSGSTALTTFANAGDTYISEPFSVYSANGCATIRSDKPVHIMQNSGHEATFCHLPNFYATNTHKTSFFSYWEDFPGTDIYPGVSIVYRDGSESGFTISYPGQTETPLFDWVTANALQIDGQGNVPGFAGWKYIRFTLPTAAANQIVSVKNATSVFQLSFSSSFPYGTNMNYLTSFNAEFSFDPDTVWTCPGIYTNLIGGIAEYYKWTLPDGSIKEGAGINTIKAKDMGMYILEMTQGFSTVIDTCWVFSINFSKNGSIGKSLSKPFKVGRPQQFIPSIDEAAAKQMTEFKWTFGGGAIPSTSTDATPTVVWNTTGVKEVTLYMKYETVYPDSTRAVCDSFLTVRIPVNPPTVEYFVDPHSPDKVGVGDQEKSDDELYYEGKSWEEPFNLEDAIAQASQGDIIYVPQGTYTPSQGNSFVINCDSVTLIGGFTGWEKDTSELVPAPDKTILQGKGDGSAVIFELDTASGACGITTATRLEGFTIQGGKAINGGGVLFKGGASGTIANCIIRNNSAKENGGGIYTEPYNGCGTSPDPVFYNLEISGNTAKNGAGIYNDGSSPRLTNVTISGNKASGSGSGVYNSGASPTILNTIIYGNVTGNEPLKDEFINAGGTPYITHSIIRGCLGGSDTWVSTYGTDGGNNADKDPIFRKQGFTESGSLQPGNYRINIHSRAFDRGSNSFVVYIPTDLDGYDRIIYDRVDMGAYEYHDDNGGTHMHEILIGSYPNLQTDPLAGKHFVVGHDSFVMIIKPATGYSLEHMKITTGSKIQDEEGGTRLERQSDGSVKVIFYKVSEPLDIQISGIGPVSTDELFAERVWSEDEILYVNVLKDSNLSIYTLSGVLYKQMSIKVGLRMIQLPKGVYVVVLDDGQKQKVVIR